MSGELTEQVQGQVMDTGYFAPKQVLAQVRAIQELMATVMQKDEHYGVIPGTQKPTLLKAGAEKLAFMFRMAPRYSFSGIELSEGHYRYEVTCSLYRNGQVMAEGIALCSSLETKYQYRKKDGQKVANENIEDQRNTVMKMAAKRALVAAVLNATAASDIFTQDLEDTPLAGEGAQPAPVAPPQRKSQATNGGDPRTMLWQECLSLANGNEAEARKVLKGLTRFETPDGKVVEGKSDVAQLSEKWAGATLTKIKKQNAAPVDAGDEVPFGE